MEQKIPLPPFTLDTAKQKVQLAEDAWTIDLASWLNCSQMMRW